MASKDYNLARDAAESERLNLQHEIFSECVGYLVSPSIAPHLPANARIADIATGTGVWMLDVGTTLPSSVSLDGWDISSQQFPKSHPSNVTFQTHDAKLPFPKEVHGKYDMVRISLLVPVMADDDWALVAGNVSQLLKPGGWLQWFEADASALVRPLRSKAGGSTGAAIRGYVKPLFKGFTGGGRLPRFFDDMLEEAGFQEVGYDCVGTEIAPHLRDQLTMSLMTAWTGIGRGKGVPEDKVQEAIKGWTEDVSNGAYVRLDLHLLTGRKPVN